MAVAKSLDKICFQYTDHVDNTDSSVFFAELSYLLKNGGRESLSAPRPTYVGLIIDGDYAYASYYTSPIDHDYGWILGMFSPTSVRIAKIDLKATETLANQIDAK